MNVWACQTYGINKMNKISSMFCCWARMQSADKCISLSVRYFGGWVECMGECVRLLCFVTECYVARDIKRECMGFVVGCCVMSGTSPACSYSQPGWVALGGNLGRNVVIQVFRQSDNPSCLAVQVLGGQRGPAKGDTGTEAGCWVDTGMDTQWLIGECYYNYPRMPPKRVPRSPHRWEGQDQRWSLTVHHILVGVRMF